MSRTVDPRFNRLRREAKRLLQDVRQADAAALSRYGHYWPANGLPNLARAQLVVAREIGYRSWTQLKTTLLSNAENSMRDQQNVTAERRLGLYTHQEAASLLRISEQELNRWGNQVFAKIPEYLDANQLTEVWCTAKPFIVTLRRNDGQRLTPEDRPVVEEKLLEAGAVITMTTIQWRFATLAEAELAAKRQTAVPGFSWIALEYGHATLRKLDQTVSTWNVKSSTELSEAELVATYFGFRPQSLFTADVDSVGHSK